MPKHRTARGIGDRFVGCDYDPDELEFLKAMELFKRVHPFPTWSEVLKVLKGLGYRKCGEASGGGDGAAGKGTALLPPP